MTTIAWVVEHSLQASERFRHLTVMPNIDFKIKSMIAQYPECPFHELDQFIEGLR